MGLDIYGVYSMLSRSHPYNFARLCGFRAEIAASFQSIAWGVGTPKWREMSLEVDTVTCLGHKFGPKGVGPDDKKIKIVRDFKPCENPREI